jgi:hypothetical protein
VGRRLLLLCALALALAPAAGAAPWLRLGFDDDTLKWLANPNGFVGAQRELGAPFTRVTIPYRRDWTKPTRLVDVYLDRAQRAGELHQKVVLAVYGSAADAPVDTVARTQFCSYVHRVLLRVPTFAAVVIWNEANSPRYWPQGTGAGAAAYEALLAHCYDVLHATWPKMNVLDSTAAHYDPASFIFGLGDAYRASGRRRAIVDNFGHNPYPDYASEPPSATHPGTGTIGEGDYATLLAAITEAFQGTAQRVPSPTWARIWYLEDGFQTAPPRALSRFYRGRENDDTVLPPAQQAAQLVAAIELAYCQPAVSGFFNFTLVDESRLGGWQSGLYYKNGVRKPAFAEFRQVAAKVAARAIDCSQVEGAPAVTP